MPDRTPYRTSALLPWGIGLGVVAAIAAGVMVLPGMRLDPIVPPPQTPDAPTVAATPDPDPTLEPQPDARRTGEPQFDLVRRERDGTMLVAGQARPHSKVSVVIDGIVRGRGDSDDAGQFVIFVVLDISAEPRVMWLLAQGAEGETLSSVDTVILTPEADATAGLAVSGTMAAIPTRPAVGQRPGPARTGHRPATGAPLPGALASDTAVAAPQKSADALTETRTDPDRSRAAGDSTGPEERTNRTDSLAAATAAPPVARVAPPAPPALLSDRDGVRVLQTAPLTGVGRVRLDSVDYSADGAVVLRGRADPGGTVTALLDGVARGRAQPDARGLWGIGLSGVDPGTYALGIVRRNGAGQVTDRVDLPFRREAPGVVAAALSGAAARVVTVQQGATLWAIARDRYGDGTRYVQVYDANRTQIRDPDLIYPGQVITLPDAARP